MTTPARSPTHSTATADRSCRPTPTSRGPTRAANTLAASTSRSFAAPQRWDGLLAEEPADEEAHVALMHAYVARGDRRAALRQYERMDRALRDELGMVPSEEATRLRDEILAVLPHANAPAAAFDDGLVGREHELDVLTDLLGAVGTGRGRAVLVSGPPGAGKSALVEQLRTARDRARLAVRHRRCRRNRGRLAVRTGARGHGRPRPPASDAARRAR